MRLPVIHGVIERRILVNYCVDPDVLAAMLPPPFRPQTIHGFGLAGICLIRLRHVRPSFVPRWLGLASENAAHRIAVEWDDRGQVSTGVYVLRRDTNSRLNALAGGRIFPGLHHHAAFDVHETANHFEITTTSRDAHASLELVADVANDLSTESIFDSLEVASNFFAAGSLGYSPGRQPNRYQGLELRCKTWDITPLTVHSIHSALYDDHKLFPPGSIHLDCALLMRDIQHQRHSRADLCCAQSVEDPQLTSVPT